MENGSKYNFSDSQIGNINIESAFHGSQIGFQQNTTIEVSDIFKELQMLLDNAVSRTPIPDEQITIVHDAIQQDPNLRKRLLGALKSGGGETLRQMFDHPVIHIPLEIIRGWLEGG